MRDRAHLINHLRRAYVGQDVVTSGWHGLQVVEDGDEAIVLFKWADDPMMYAIRLRLNVEHPFWWDEPRGGLEEELLTGLVERAPRTVVDGVTELDMTAPRTSPDPPPFPRGIVSWRLSG